MTQKKLILFSMFLLFYLVSCNERSKNKIETKSINENLLNLKKNDMKSYISMFEIPATDINRAIKFYEVILGVTIDQMDIEGMQMGIFPYEDQMVTGVIIKADGYKPSADGVTIYLNAGDDLDAILDRVDNNGGKILLPKTAHADESGYFALFLDSEGNRMALNSTINHEENLQN